MALPTFQELMRPSLELSKSKLGFTEAVGILADQLNLSEEDRNAKTPKNQKSAFRGRVGWAITYLRQAGLVRRPERGYFEITEAGLTLLAAYQGNINVRFLKDNTEFLANPSAPKKSPKSEIIPQSDLSPTELVEEAINSINDSIQKDLLERILDESPAFFEYLVIELLKAMGYGESGDIAEAVGRSGDGGIDGIIYEDKLGLDVVYIQAKRYDPSNTIGRPALQSFIGSLAGFSATKGVFITTSSFSSNVGEYLKSVQQRVVTIDGEQLVRLMLENGVGVRLESSYQVLKVDEDFFGG
jgi:restriction system protein|tara:strand:+ start:223 stop:1119 length:897 start_codon:yes stop_codon:yes gene_type:complete